MKYYLDNQKINIYPGLLKILGKGSEGTVYKYNNKALKIHSSLRKEGIGLDECKTLQNLNGFRILVPENILSDERNEFCGYTTPLIENETDIYKIRKEKLLGELYLLRKEVNYFSKNRILLDDLILVNFKYDGIMHFVDPGRYELWNDDDLLLKIHNDNTIKNFIINELIYAKIRHMTGSYILADRNSNSIDKDLSSNYDSIEDYFEDKMQKGENLDSFIQKTLSY